MTLDKKAFIEKIQKDAQSLQNSFEAFKANVENNAEKSKENVDEKIAALKVSIKEQEAKAKQLQQDIENWAADKKEHTQETISSWKKKREIAKLDRRAEKAQKHAAHCVERAVVHVVAAEYALLEAISATIEAEEAREEATEQEATQETASA
ncbi:hypothetical protein LP316_11955 [Thalassotalea sp. LPB0316]|uniref:hypothetical protein n=1 Tax=Thalassotalea sp. LPB0316 TaxID=2769490 RepID=UPI0018696AD7|nr:hypothetical protein [Thalassotalea sp. LPB0316]QOL25015.1 hypothetical protein LP316_11955 [Thalassotalea sp. LPB0316]